MPQVDAPGYWEPGPAPPPKRGLFSVAEIHDGVDPHLMMGANYMTNRCTAGSEWLDFCSPLAATVKQFMKLSIVKGLSATVYDALDCEPVGVSADEQETRLLDTFDVKAEAVMEASLERRLRADAALPAASLTEMIAVLEEELAQNYAGLGTLHMDRYTSLSARAAGLVEIPTSPDGPIETINGTPVAAGRGYYRDADQFWAGACGRVIILRGPKSTYRTPPSLDRAPQVLVEQPFVILAECVAVWTEAP